MQTDMGTGLLFRKTQDGGVECYVQHEEWDDSPEESKTVTTVVFVLDEAQANALVVAHLRGPVGYQGPMGMTGRDGGPHVHPILSGNVTDRERAVRGG